MKAIKYLFLSAAMGVMLASCEEMELEPKGMLSEQILFKNDTGIKRYLASAYQKCPIEDLQYAHKGNGRIGFATLNNNGTGGDWEALKAFSGASCYETGGRGGSDGYRGAWGWDMWEQCYARIRDLNNFLEKIDSYGSNFSEDMIEMYKGEVRGLRGLYYGAMVQRYGGVILVDKVLDPGAGEANYQARATEYDSWKFVIDDLQYAMEHASTDKSQSFISGRMNRYAAAALLARYMMHAASNALYCDVPNVAPSAGSRAGLRGMPADKAEEFLEICINACQFLKDAGFSLHNGADKEQAFLEEFKNPYNGDEDIWVKQYTTVSEAIWETNLFHSWDGMVLPKAQGLSATVGCSIQPTLESLNLFEHPAYEDEEGKPVRFNDRSEFWNTDEMEPRCRATIYFSGMTETCSKVEFDFLAGVYDSYPGLTADACPEDGGSNCDYNTEHRTMPKKGQLYTNIGGNEVKFGGIHGPFQDAGDEDYTYTGMIIRKYVSDNPTWRTDLRQSQNTCKLLRYGEVLLNWAEACYELGLIRGSEALKMQAIDLVNEVRERAGAKPYTYNPNPEDLGSETFGYVIDENLQFIRDERGRELMFENRRVFDLMRWRVLDKMVEENNHIHTLRPYYVADEGKFIFLPQMAPQNNSVNFSRNDYYLEVPGGQIAKNPLVIRNYN